MWVSSHYRVTNDLSAEQVGQGPAYGMCSDMSARSCRRAAREKCLNSRKFHADRTSNELSGAPESVT
jgi:hypothetical protein